jgi:hypothetical protein
VNRTNYLDPDVVKTNAQYCVGQYINLEARFTPPVPNVESVVGWWKLTGKFVNDSWQHTRYVVLDPLSGGGGLEHYGSVNYTNNPANLQINTNFSSAVDYSGPSTHAWWVDGGNKTASVGLTLVLSNGQYAAIPAMGKFRVYSPWIDGPLVLDTVAAPASVQMNTDDLPDVWLGVAASYVNTTGCYAWHVHISADNISFPNMQFQMAYLINRQSRVGIDYSSTSGDYWLDNTYPAVNVDQRPDTNGLGLTLSHMDTPGVCGEYSPIDMTDQFMGYIQFKPDQFNSIPVTIGLMTWGWHGYASKSNGVWTKSTNSTITPNPNVVEYHEFPKWLYVYGNSNVND